MPFKLGTVRENSIEPSAFRASVFDRYVLNRIHFQMENFFLLLKDIKTFLTEKENLEKIDRQVQAFRRYLNTGNPN
jgi:hypothetical protein